jgi:hypothetical protein
MKLGMGTWKKKVESALEPPKHKHREGHWEGVSKSMVLIYYYQEDEQMWNDFRKNKYSACYI